MAAREPENYLATDNFLADVARGLVEGASVFAGFGEKEASGGDFHVTVWNGPTDQQPIPPPEGVQISIVSDNAADTAAGTGIRSVEIHYLDANGNSQSEIVTLDGLTPVLTQATDIRFIQCAHAMAVGSGNWAAGNIDFSNGGTVYKRIAVSCTRCLSSLRMVPAGKRALVRRVTLAASGGSIFAQIDGHFIATSLDHQLVAGIFFPQVSMSIQNSSDSVIFDPPIPFPAFSIIGVCIDTNLAAHITGSWYGWIEDAHTSK